MKNQTFLTTCLLTLALNAHGQNAQADKARMWQAPVYINKDPYINGTVPGTKPPTSRTPDKNTNTAPAAVKYSYTTSFPPDGEATYQYSNGSMYVGTWKDGRRNGKGEIFYSDGYTWDGDWLNDQRNGYGRSRKDATALQQGYWENDLYIGLKPGKLPVQKMTANGQGTYTYPDGSIYIGEWEKFLKKGRGTMTWVNGNNYEGEWYDTMSGKGTLIWANGDKYVGDFDHGAERGIGTMTYANGDIFVGGWSKNQKESGTLTYADGSKFSGYWQDDQRHAWGKLCDANGTIIKEGFWNKGEFDQAATDNINQNKVVLTPEELQEKIRNKKQESK